MNRHISIYKIGNQLTTTLADYRRADIFSPNDILNLFVRISRCKYIHTIVVFFFQYFPTKIKHFMKLVFLFLVGQIEVFSKHDHTQFRLIASVDDQKYNPTIPLQYISFASFNETPIQFYYDCSMTPSYIDTETAKRYANPGHPLLIEDPAFRTPIDKRNCKWFFFECYQLNCLLVGGCLFT